MSDLSKRAVAKARIHHEVSSLVVAPDGSVREAREGEDSPDLAIRAMPDMLPVPHNSPLRTWGVFSLGGYWVAEAFGVSAVLFHCLCKEVNVCYRARGWDLTAGLRPAGLASARLPA